jgi:hypothetical protein
MIPKETKTEQIHHVRGERCGRRCQIVQPLADVGSGSMGKTDVLRRFSGHFSSEFDVAEPIAMLIGAGFSFLFHNLERIRKMQTAKQLSVTLVNKPGRLVDMLLALNKSKVNFRALCVMDSGDRGSVRFVPDDVEVAVTVLEEMNIRCEATDVLLAEIPSQSGGFRKICEKLAADHLNIDYAYCSFNGGGKLNGGVLAVVKVNDLAKAQRVLSENGTVRKKKPFRRPVMSR